MKEDENLEKLIEQHKREKEQLKLEISRVANQMYLLHHYQQSMLDSVGVSILCLDQSYALKKANQYALNSVFKDMPLEPGEAVLPRLRYNNAPLASGNVPDLIGKDIEVSFLVGESEWRSMSAIFTRLYTMNAKEEILLTMKDVQDIRQKDSEIKELQNQLIDSAYRDGVTENAVAVLHNIGNILTAIIGKVSDQGILNDLGLMSSVLGKFAVGFEGIQTPEQLGDYLMNNPKAKAIPNLIRELAKTSLNAEKELRETIDDVKQKCVSISEVIATQQNYANFRENAVTEIVARQVILDCLSMNKEKIQKRAIEVNMDEFPPVLVPLSKVGFAQTVMNCITNAIEAIDERYKRDPTYVKKTINISASDTPEELTILIQDNGAGIAPEIQQRLFRFGFSTKNRSSGFGLHNCANFMKSQGGSIEIRSDGIDQGACSVLVCKHKQGESSEAA